ncbi:MAG: hypothetical protein HND53_06855 [Proteobacteria bacterium]|nr:hypothetical protein [Pseudomonadota bacterium]
MANAELSDPTRPATYFEESIEPIYVEEFDSGTKEKISWKLSAIRISDNDRTAIVNGKLVRVGDEVESAKVLEINPLSVLIDHEERKLIVRLFNIKVIKDYKSVK